MPAESSQVATRRSRLGARTQARWLRLQIHGREGRVRLYTMNGANWSDPLSTHCGRCGAQIKGHAIIDAEVVCLDSKGIAQSWIKVKNPKAPAATRILDPTF